ncbi:MAG: hypothetical protein AAFN74_27520 [Myxococcota bacterium]
MMIKSNTQYTSSLHALSVATLICTGCASAKSGPTPSAKAPVASIKAPAQISLTGPFQSASVVTFSPEGTLFVADSGTGKVYALNPGESSNPAAQAPYNLKGVDAKLAALLGTTSQNVRIRDMAVHPQTKELYLSVGRVTGESYASAIVVLNQLGVPRLLDLSVPMKVVQIPFAPASGFAFYDEVPARDLSITDIEYHDGRLYVAGLSNADFASSLWSVPVPFDDGSKVSTTTVEIYHAIHNQQETRAPIRTMKIARLNGEDHLIAAYTCTPLVVIPLKSIQNGAHVVGKTIGELGYGNTPADLITFTGQDAQQKPFEVLFLSNKNQAAQVMGLAAIEAAVQKEGLSKPLALTKFDFGAKDVPMTSLMQVADQDPYHLVVVRRDVEEGDIEAVSYLKNVYFRLSDFQSEYEIPGYSYTEDQKALRDFQNMMKKDEGKEKFVVQ